MANSTWGIAPQVAQTASAPRPLSWECWISGFAATGGCAAAATGCGGAGVGACWPARSSMPFCLLHGKAPLYVQAPLHGLDRRVLQDGRGLLHGQNGTQVWHLITWEASQVRLQGCAT